MSKYIRVGTGAAPFEEATAITTSAGAGDAGKIPATNSAGEIDITFLPAGVGSSIYTMTASGAISAGDAVSIIGANQVARADADNSRPAHGIATASIADLATGPVAIGEYIVSGLAGLTSGARYYLSTTPGQITTSLPAAPAFIQAVGVAKSTTELAFAPSQAIIQRN